MAEFVIGAGVLGEVSMAHLLLAFFLIVEMLVWNFLMSGVIVGVLILAGILGETFLRFKWYLTLEMWLGI